MPKELKAANKSHRTDPYPVGNMASHSNPSHRHNSMTAINNERPSMAWSHDDDELLMRSRAQNMNWGPIAATHFPSKTPNACRKRHERLMEKRNAENWDGVKLEELARAYVDSREMMWKILADKVGEKWQHVEIKVRPSSILSLPTSHQCTSIPLHHTIQNPSH